MRTKMCCKQLVTAVPEAVRLSISKVINKLQKLREWLTPLDEKKLHI